MEVSMVTGIVVFKGIGIGKCQRVKEAEYKINKEHINPRVVVKEVKRVENAKSLVVEKLQKLKKYALEHIGEEEADIFDAHLMMMDDPMFIDAIYEKIKKQNYSAERAVMEIKKEVVALFEQMDDPYIKERAKDIEDISNKMLDVLLGIDSNPLENINEPTIIIADDLKPSQTVMLSENVKGIILGMGSVTSHAAIVAKAKGIPTIIGMNDVFEKVSIGDVVILDAENNQVLINPDNETLDLYQEQVEMQDKEKERLKSMKDLEAVTLDGHKIKLYGNVGSLEETKYVIEQGGRGVGLLRTEFLYMNNTQFPTEEEQFKEYKQIAQQAGEEVIIRTLDIGGDKTLPYFEFPQEMNPFLGFRAIRFCLERKDIFHTQLRAILRASAYGKVKIMFPMIAIIEELRQAKQCLEDAKKSLDQEGVAYDQDIEVGIMIEIPSTAISADLFAKEVDFFSIGTNDLCQYTLAVDRMNVHVSHLYQALNPSMINLIDMAVQGAHRKAREIGVCGEMASDELGALILVGLGVDELSVSPSMIPKIKERIRQSRYSDLKQLVEKVKSFETQDEIIKEVERGIQHVN